MPDTFDKRHWFVREVAYWRLVASLAWYLLLQPATVTLFLFSINFSLYNPLQWFSGWLSMLFSMTAVILLCLVGCCNFCMSLYNAHWFTVHPTVHKTRWSIILDVTRPGRLLHTITSAAAGGFTMWCLSSAMGGQYNSLVVQCPQQKTCLNEHHLMLVLFGVYMGTVRSISYFLYGNNVLRFPVIKQLKFFLVKSNILPSFYEAFRSSIRHLLYFYAIYIIFGCLPRDWLETNLQLERSISQWESVYSLFDLSFFWYMWMSASCLHHFWHFALFLMKMYTTEVYEFPMEAALIEQEDGCLDKILSASSPFVKYQAFHDLQDLSEHSKRRRGWIYSLSQPGGHPHRWNRVCTECLELIDSLTNCLLAHHNELTNGKLQERYSTADQGNTHSSNGSTNSGTFTTSFQQTVLHTPRSPVLYSPSDLPMKIEETGVYNYENDTVFSSAYTNTQYPAFRDQLRRRPIHSAETSAVVTRPAGEAPTVIVRPGRLARLKHLRVVKYLLEPLPDSSSRDLFQDCQLHIWAVEALSSLVVSSLREDTYGVVQQTLPNVLVSLMSLSNAIEKHMKFLSNSKDIRQRSDLLALKSSASVARLRGDLQGSLKTALHGIIATFGHHLSNIKLPSDYNKQLSHLMEYKE